MRILFNLEVIQICLAPHPGPHFPAIPLPINLKDPVGATRRLAPTSILLD